MTSDIIIRDFIEKHEKTIFVYSILIALESVLLNFRNNIVPTVSNDGLIYQAALFSVLMLILIIWVRFVWDVLGQLRLKSIDSIIDVVTITQNTLFAFLLFVPILALFDSIYRMDVNNFIPCILFVFGIVILYGFLPSFKYLTGRLNKKNCRILAFIITPIALILLYAYIQIGLSPGHIIDSFNSVMIILIFAIVLAFVISFNISILSMALSKDQNLSDSSDD